MKLEEKIYYAKFKERPNRFVAKVEFKTSENDNKIVLAHVPDPGRLIELLTPDADVILRKSTNPERKTRYSLVGVKTSDIWGYARKGSLYIQKGELFNRMPVLGSICHFVANVTVYNDRHYDPYYNYSYNVQPNTTNELRQFILDFETGKVLEYNYESVLIILMRDEELYEEFNNLKKRKKREKKFLYVRKYNEKYPLYFPVN